MRESKPVSDQGNIRMTLLNQSQIKETAQNEGNLHERIKTMIEQEDADVSLSPINLYHELKAVTPSREQHELASPAFKSSSPKPQVQRFKTHLGFELQGSSCENEEEELKPIHIMEENTAPNSSSTGSCGKKGENHVVEEKITPDTTTLKAYPLPLPPLGDVKDKCVMGGDRIMGLASRRKGNISTTVTGQLSIETSTPRGTQDEDEPEKAEKVEMDESRILVFVRLRPMTKGEKDLGAISNVTVMNRRDVCLIEPANENDYLGLKRLRRRHFKFDASFPDTASQQEVYSTTTAELVEAVLQGRNGSVFCYGATGAGKTYTMLGTTDNPGIMVLAIKDIFSKIRERSYDGNYAVHLSYLEVYNETVRDLLSLGRPLVLREDKQGIVAAGLTQYRAYSTDEVMALLQKGNQNRTTEPNHVNESSSRSHAILQVVVGYQVRDQAMNVIQREGKVSLIDLAGSERAFATDPKTLRAIEGANINRSLLSLSICINALVEGRKHIPYRDSKLTQLLKDSLGGSCNTVMIANISPSNLSFSETQNTLHWADRAKELRTKAGEVNEYLLPLPESEADRDKLLIDLQKENLELRVECARLQKKLSVLRAKYMVANSSSPSSNTSPLASPTSMQPLKSPKPRASSLPGACFTPETKLEEADEAIGILRRTVKELEAEKNRMKNDHALQLEQKEEIIHLLSMKIENLSRELEAEIERIKNDHAVQLEQKEEIIHQLPMNIENQSGEQEAEIERIKNDHHTMQLEQKEEIIRQLSLKIENHSGDKQGANRIERASSLPKELPIGELKISGVQLLAPDLTAGNRSIWRITTDNRSSIATLNGRDIRSHVANEPAAGPPSMLLRLAYPYLWFVILFGLHVIGCTM